jgi:PQQ-dependent dehydrogenase (s-GDH family)
MRIAHTLSYCVFILMLLKSSSIQSQDESFFMTQIGPNNLLDTPFDLLYGPDGYLWITERADGVILRVNPETAERDELIKIDEVSAIIGQDGLLGIALHEGFLEGNPYLYTSYTHLVDGVRKQKLVRYTYEINADDGTLSDPVTLIDNLPASNDHNSGRILYGPDGKLYYTIGDQGGNQNANYCNPIVAQILPTQEEINIENWTHYPGKVLRLNTDGSIPEDNPMMAGVQSHVYSYGHRNPQGLVFSSAGSLYADEHGPNTDDEVNMIIAGNNYGWPNVVGYQDDQAYDYCDWSSLSNCPDVKYSNGTCPEGATFAEESSFMSPTYKDPLFSMFAVTDDYNYDNPACQNAWICRPNVAPSSINIYESDAIPAWKNSLLVTSLKRGRVYRLKLDDEGTAIVGDTMQLFYTQNRYRDIVIHPDGKSFFLITDQSGRTSTLNGLNATSTLQNPGAILRFTLQESVAADNQDLTPLFHVWPNPTSDHINIDLEKYSAQVVSAEIRNISGQLVKKVRGIQPGTNEISVNDLTSGVYILRLSSKDRSWQERVVVY